MKKLYAERSAIVHGSHIENFNLTTLESSVRQSLMRFLDLRIANSTRDHESIIKELDFN